MPRGRLASNIPSGKVSEVKFPCRVSAQLDENGDMTLSVNGTGEYIEGGTIGATIEMDEIPDDLVAKLKKAMQEVLDESHDDLKDEFIRERGAALAIHAQMLRSTETPVQGVKKVGK